MKFFDLVNISERYMDLINPSTPEKTLKIGDILGLKEGWRVVDCGCGFGEALALWAEEFGICGLGVDVREYACERARQKMAERGLVNRIEIVCANAAEYDYGGHSFDAAACIGASFIWKGFRPAIKALAALVPDGGKLAIGEPYWLTERVPPEYANKEHDMRTEHQLLQVARSDLQTQAEPEQK